MDIVKIKTWIRSFAKQNKIWFESYDEIPEIPQTSFIEGKLYIEINQFYDITIGFFEYTKDIIEENVFVCKHKLFVWQLSDFSTEKSLFETIYRKIKIYLVPV